MNKYKCWNPDCSHYAGWGHVIRSRRRLTICPHCGQKTLETLVSEPPTGAKTAAGTAGGALLGWAIGGPLGAVVGGLIGLIIGAATESEPPEGGK